ncbi:MAG: class I SAM-dependent methyltransferase [Hyphomicrobiaceae bacterium]
MFKMQSSWRRAWAALTESERPEKQETPSENAAQLYLPNGTPASNADVRYDDLSETYEGRTLGQPGHLRSGFCQQADFFSDRYRHWMEALGEAPRLHRKQWEFYYICQALDERAMLAPDRRGLGFGVGVEPLTALFAARGAKIVATDLELSDAQADGWVDTDQHASGLELLNQRGLCPDDDFRRLVSFRAMNMNCIPTDFDGTFDFCWSACSLEHIGSLQHGLDFIMRSVETLKPGGIAVHTTEYNLSSNDDTLDTPTLALYRRRDIEALIDRVEAAGHSVSPIDWSSGSGFVDGYIDLPPYRDEPHLKLKIFDYDCASIGLIIQRAAR